MQWPTKNSVNMAYQIDWDQYYLKTVCSASRIILLPPLTLQLTAFAILPVRLLSLRVRLLSYRWKEESLLGFGEQS